MKNYTIHVTETSGANPVQGNSPSIVAVIEQARRLGWSRWVIRDAGGAVVARARA